MGLDKPPTISELVREIRDERIYCNCPEHLEENDKIIQSILENAVRSWVGEDDDYMDTIKNNPFLHIVDAMGVVIPKSPQIEIEVQKSVEIKNFFRHQILKSAGIEE